jgi:hypothetical protein
MLKLMSCLLAVAMAAGSLPFWKSKAKVYERVQNREVIVSVTNSEHKLESPRYELFISGGGQSQAPCDFIYKNAQHYEEIARLGGYVTEAKYHPDTQIMDVSIEALFHQASFKEEIKATAPPAPPRLDFRVVEGSMTGLAWHLDFVEVKPGICEVGMEGGYHYDEFPIPRIFLDFGMETVFKHMGERLREHMEGRWKAEKPQAQTATIQ